MFYELLIRYIDGKEIIRFHENDRAEMIELLNIAIERWDVAYIHVSKRDEDGCLLNQKMLEGVAFNDFLENC